MIEPLPPPLFPFSLLIFKMRSLLRWDIYGSSLSCYYCDEDLYRLEYDVGQILLLAATIYILSIYLELMIWMLGSWFFSPFLLFSPIASHFYSPFYLHCTRTLREQSVK
jgi:hypothetical protein